MYNSKRSKGTLIRYSYQKWRNENLKRKMYDRKKSMQLSNPLAYRAVLVNGYGRTACAYAMSSLTRCHGIEFDIRHARRDCIIRTNEMTTKTSVEPFRSGEPRIEWNRVVREQSYNFQCQLYTKNEEWNQQIFTRNKMFSKSLKKLKYVCFHGIFSKEFSFLVKSSRFHNYELHFCYFRSETDRKSKCYGFGLSQTGHRFIVSSPRSVSSLPCFKIVFLNENENKFQLIFFYCTENVDDIEWISLIMIVKCV